MANSYTRMSRKNYRNLADHFHDKAVDAISPEAAARWVLLMDAAMWAADDHGDAEQFEKLTGGAA